MLTSALGTDALAATLVGNVRDLCRLLPALNIGADPDLDFLTRDIETRPASLRRPESEGSAEAGQWLKYKARGFRNRERFRNAIYFHLGGLDLYPGGTSGAAHTKA
jgi:hypothetical protein